MDMNPMAYVSIAVTLFITGANCAFWAVTKFNDLKHLTKDVSEIKGDVKTLVQNSQKLEVRMATQEEHCKIMHKRIRRNRTPEKNT
jgi:hypothetical protein